MKCTIGSCHIIIITWLIEKKTKLNIYVPELVCPILFRTPCICNAYFQILRIDPSEDFNIHFPYRRGDLNVHPGPGGSITAIMADLETIWTHVLDTHFGISRKNLKFYRAVLVIPDVYNRTYLRELTTLLLAKIGFGSCFLVQVCI